MSKFIVGAWSDGIYEALHEAGVFADKPEDVRRVVIDLEAGSPARIYIDKYADDRLTEVLFAGGIQIVERESDEAAGSREEATAASNNKEVT